MDFNKAMDGLPRIVKVLIAIFLDIIYVIYRIVADVTDKRIDLLFLDIIFGIILCPVFWILNIVYIVIYGNVFSFGEWIKPGAA